MTRELFGRILCFALGALYTAGAVPLFTFGPTGKHLWSLIESQVAALASTIGVAPWIATTLLGFFAIGGPIALVWLIAGKQVNRVKWLLAGVCAYGALGSLPSFHPAYSFLSSGNNSSEIMRMLERLL